MDIKELVNCGFTENQAKIYILLLKNPGISAGKIAKGLSIDRSFTYNIIESLMKRGLVYFSLVKKGKIFFPEKPMKILEDLESKRDIAKSVVDKLKNIKKENKSISSIEIYEGKQALKKYLSQLINAKHFFTLGGGGRLNIFNILKYEYPHYFNKLRKSKISGKIICSHENKKFWKTNLKETSIEIKSLEGAGKENSITLLKNKIIFSEETKLPNIIILNNEHHAHSLNHYFLYLWKSATK